MEKTGSGEPGGVKRAVGGTNRRAFLRTAALGAAGSAVFARALHALADDAPRVTAEMIRQAEWIAGLELTDGDRELMLRGLNETVAGYDAMRAVPLDNEVAPAFRFDPEPPGAQAPLAWDVPRPDDDAPSAPARRPRDETDLAFLPVHALAALVARKEVSPVELTRLALDRLAALDPVLHCVIRTTPERAMEQARRAEREIVRGRPRGPLHGIPWGAKDLLAVEGYPTTWGATPFKDQVRPGTATAVRRLDDAGAVLVAKLALGSLAWGDVWYGEMTRNPWNTEQGSSGSSAGSASAVSAGLVPFALGSETWGSIVSPGTRCGVSGLRPTFGRISRHGAMALSWTMDKLGPMARHVDDLALVFAALHGADGRDRTAVDRPFAWPPARSPRALRVGYVASQFEEARADDDADAETRASLAAWQQNDRRTLDVLREAGVNLVPIDLPDDLPLQPLSVILTSEAAAAFDELTRSGRDDELVRQEDFAWPNFFRQGQLVPAVEYIRANRIRTLLMERMARLFDSVDAYVSPSFGGDNLLLTNLTGHPQLVMPNGFAPDGTPTSITITGRPWGESEILSLGRLYQRTTDHHLRRPPAS